MRCLWIARYIPYPLDAGAKVYSAKLAESLAAGGVIVRFMGIGESSTIPAQCAHVDWLPIKRGTRLRSLAAMFSPPPHAAAIDASDAYIRALKEQLRTDWDAIVLDGYGAGWALKACLQYREAHKGTCLIHVSHNHEERLWRGMARDSDVSLLRKLALWQNYYKVHALEQRIVRSVDLLTTITEEDRQSLGGELDPRRTLTLTPGFEGLVAGERRIDVNTPRRVILMGSFRWVVKQENLKRFIALADPLFFQNGIELDVVGDVPPDLLAALRRECRAVRFHGFVQDVAELFAGARIAVVPELFGGGFKLKFLDYFFARVPVAALSQAAAGLPAQLREQTIARDNLSDLVEAIIANMDRLDDLNRMQRTAFAHSRARFTWHERAFNLREAIMNQHMGEAQRLDREREYHNQRFADDSERDRRVGRFYSAISYGFELYRRRVCEAARGRRVLEYGCGTGSLAFDLADRAGHVIGIDISDVAIRQAHLSADRRRLSNVEFCVDNAESMQLPAKHVDVVAGSGIVHHLDIPKAMQEVRRVLTPGGIAIFAEPLAHNPFVNWYRRRTPELRTADEHPLTVTDLRAIGRGFSSSRFTYFGLVAPVLGLISRDSNAAAPLTRFMWWLDKWICRVPFLKRYAWYCVLEVHS